MTIDEVLTNISIHLHLSKEMEHEILAEIRTHLEDAVEEAVIKGEDEQMALMKAAEQFGIDEVGVEIQHVHANWEAVDAVFVTALPVLFAVALRWLTYAPDGSTRNWQQLLAQPGFYVLAFASLVIPFLILHRWRYALIGWGIFWFLTVIFVVYPSVQHW
jgi:hypothetical protein